MESIAIIGTGVSAMGAAYFLRNKYDITFYEKNNYPGGHTNTVTVEDDGAPVDVDTAFMVYNEVTYPNLTRLFKELNVETKPTNMSFSVQHVPSGLEYCGTGVKGLFAQKRNILNPGFIKMLFDINRFNKESGEVLANEEKYFYYTLQDYVKEKKYGKAFLERYLIPMSSAVWSTPPDRMLKFPAVTLIRFFQNHGFLGMGTQYQWRTVVGGSKVYRDKILGSFKNRIFLNNPVKRVRRKDDKVLVYDAHGLEKSFDKVIIACHAPQALELLSDLKPIENALLKDFQYQKNSAVLHTDEKTMPRTRSAWSSWNYRMQYDAGKNLIPTTIYYMNSLQGVSDKKNYFVSINDPGKIDPKKILWKTDYYHPLFTVETARAQKEIYKLNENGQIYFCGAYFKYGFHEDGLNSGMDVAKKILGGLVW